MAHEYTVYTYDTQKLKDNQPWRRSQSFTRMTEELEKYEKEGWEVMNVASSLVECSGTSPRAFDTVYRIFLRRAK